jgi:hypothetical protein
MRLLDLSTKCTASSPTKVDLWILLPCVTRGECTSIHCLSKSIFEKFVSFDGMMNMEQVRRPCVQEWSLWALWVVVMFFVVLGDHIRGV